MHDSIVNRQEAPYASHGLYTQPGVLDDTDPRERLLGITAGFMYREIVEETAVYVDLGLSPGMQAGVENALKMSHPVDYRMFLNGWEGERPTASLSVELHRNDDAWLARLGGITGFGTTPEMAFSELARLYQLSPMKVRAASNL